MIRGYRILTTQPDDPVDLADVDANRALIEVDDVEPIEVSVRTRITEHNHTRTVRYAIDISGEEFPLRATIWFTPEAVDELITKLQGERAFTP